MTIQPWYWVAKVRLALSILYGSRRSRRAILGKALYTACILVLLLLAYMVVEWNDQRTEWRLKVKAERQQANRYEAMLLDCMNGKSPGLFYTNEKGHRIYFACDKAWELNVGEVS